MTSENVIAKPRRAVRNCCLCGATLERRRADARFCSDPHRVEASRQRRLLAGHTVDGCHSLAEYLQRRQSRTSDV